MTNTQSILLAVVEGLTEYLPVSSTGHIIIASWFLGINQEPFVKDYTVMVQFGAILAVVLVFWKRFVLNLKMYPRVFLAFLPAAVIGLSTKKMIEHLLGNVTVVGTALFVGGILLVLTDHWVKRQRVRVTKLEAMSLPAAVKIGFFQCLALIPGTSRSAATIWGGIFEGLSLPLATEFSFFLAVPTLTGATVLELYKVWPTITSDQIGILALGNVISFIVGGLTINLFLRIVSRFGLRHFGYYRILAGGLVLTLVYLGHDIQVV